MASVGFQEPEKPQKSSINFSLPLDSMDDDDGNECDDLTQRIEEFKYHNPEEVEELKKCIQEVLSEAENTAQERLDKKEVRIHKHISYISMISCNFLLHLFDFIFTHPLHVA